MEVRDNDIRILLLSSASPETCVDALMGRRAGRVSVVLELRDRVIGEVQEDTKGLQKVAEIRPEGETESCV